LIGDHAIKRVAITSPNLAGVAIYTKGKLSLVDGMDTYYLLVSSKRAL